MNNGAPCDPPPGRRAIAGAAALRAVRLRHDASALVPARQDALPLIHLHQRQERGWDTCPFKSISAGAMEQFVIDQLKRRIAVPAPAGSPPPAAWDALTPHQQAGALRRLVERVDYDGAAQTVAITFRPTEGPAPADALVTAQEGETV